MKIDVNGSTHKVAAKNLTAALEELGWGEARVATALNGRFVPVAERANTPLSAGDRLEVLEVGS